MTTVVTGGAGFIGSALCRQLVSDPTQEVVVIDKLTYAANIDSISALKRQPNFTLRQIDICDYELTRDAIMAAKPSAILHLAAESHVDRSITGSDVFIQTNVMGTHNILKAARAHWDTLEHTLKEQFRMLHVSTDEVYGSLGSTGAFNEQSAFDPSSPYSASKAASDHIVTAWHRTYGLPTLTANCSNNYGPYQNPEKLIPLMIINCLEERALPIYGNGRQIRDWIYVEDHVQALLKILTSGEVGQTYCVGSENERQNLDVVKQICQIVDECSPSNFNREELITFVTDRPGHDIRYAIDASKINGLGWRAKEDFESGLRKTVNWYINNKTWWHR